MNDLQLVAFVKIGCGPKIPGNDVPVEFHRNSVSLHAEGFDEGSERKWSG